MNTAFITDTRTWVLILCNNYICHCLLLLHYACGQSGELAKKKEADRKWQPIFVR
jgi:hypothetical protein